MTRTPDPPNPDKPGRFALPLPLSRQSWRQLPLLACHSLYPNRPAPTRCERKSERKTQDQTKFYVGDVWKLMTVPREGAERLAEIFREIFALSETDGSNHSKSAAVDDSIQLFDAQRASGISEICGPNAKQASDEGSQAEHQEPLT